MPTWHRCAPPILFWPWPPYNLFPRSCLTFLCRFSLMGTTLRAAFSKSYAFSTNYHACIVYLPTWCRCAPPFFTLTSIEPAPEVVFNFLLRSSLMGTTLCAASSKSYAFSINYHACIVMPTWRRCAPPILFWPWPPYNLRPRSCLSWIFFLDPHW